MATAGFARFRHRVNSNVSRLKTQQIRPAMLTDLIAAKSEDASAVLDTLGYASVWSTLQAKSVDSVKLASLAFILKGLPPDDELVIEYMKSFRSLASAGEEGPWVELVPDDLVELLSRLSESQLGPVARAWAATEEAKLDRWVEADVKELLGHLSALAASALTQNLNILLRVCQ